MSRGGFRGGSGGRGGRGGGGQYILQPSNLLIVESRPCPGGFRGGGRGGFQRDAGPPETVLGQ